MSTPARANSARGYIVLSLAWLAVVGIVWFVARRPAPQPIEILPPPTVLPSPSPLFEATPAPVRVDVAGAVRSPGVYRLPSGSIVADAISAAGGPAPEAELDRINKAAPLQDGSQVYVPRAGETPVATASEPITSSRATSGLPSSAASPVDLNHATVGELDVLPGIGPSLAAAIVAGRPYATVDDLLSVPGVGPATLAKLRPYVVVR